MKEDKNNIVVSLVAQEMELIGLCDITNGGFPGLSVSLSEKWHIKISQKWTSLA